MPKYSLDRSKIKVLLLEGIHENAEKLFKEHGYSNVESLKVALDNDDLIKKIQDVHILGIRSRTLVTEEVLRHAKKLLTIGCFSIGTNQVKLEAARLQGIPVFNAPYSNTRSVAELIIAEIIMLMRGVPMKNALAHKGKWFKSARGSYEVRGKVLGIIGYGHIGSQVSILAEALGMQVYYYDIVKKLSLGNARECNSLDELLAIADVITLHVPSTQLTRNMISERQIAKIKKGACLINAARGDVVDYKAMAKALENGHISAAAIDVFPEEPASEEDPFVNELQNFDNVILTPHIGGSTLEAQANIGLEVSHKMIKYSNTGSTLSAVNFPEIDLLPNEKKQRFLHIHRNVPGVMQHINHLFSSKNINISSQYLQTDPDIGYVIVDTDSELPQEFLEELKSIPDTIKARMLY